MDNSITPTASINYLVLASLIVFTFLNAVARMTRHALASLRNRTPLEEDLERLKKNKAINWIMDNARQFTSGIEFISISLMFGQFYLAFSLFQSLIFHKLDSIWPSLICSGVFVGAMQFLVYDWFLKAIANERPQKTLHKTTWITVGCIFLTSPFKWPFQHLRNVINNFSKYKNDKEVNLLDVEVLIHSLEDQETALTPSVRKIMGRAMTLNELEVSDVLLPRNQVNFLDVYKSVEDNLAMAKESGHTRFPLCEGDLDNCLGIVHIKDIFRFAGNMDQLDLRKVMRNFTTFSPDDSLDEVMQRLLLLKMHMAVVKDEFGGTVGVITLEQILEELVGEIQDEFDMEEKQVEVISHDYYKVQGLTPIHDVEEELDIRIDNEEVSTFGGLITAEIGRIPNPTERLELENLEVIIDKVDDRRILSTKVRVISRPDDEDQNEENRSEDK